MITVPINQPTVGAYVWSENGHSDHGPLEGPKITIPPRTLGQIVGTEKPYSTMDQLLYTVLWTSGQMTKHYFKQLFCIGLFDNIDAFQVALGTAQQATLVLGPRGGFREFTATIFYAGTPHTLSYSKECGSMFRQFVEPVLKQAGIRVSLKTQ